jgi:hypothetical protein
VPCCSQVIDDLVSDSANARRVVRYSGKGLMLPLLISYAARGGQVVLSEQAWESVKDTVTQHPAAVSVLSLGQHILSYEFSKPMHLMEVMPTLLSRRNFAHIQTKRMVEPGYRDAPDPSKPMAIAFMKVCVAWVGLVVPLSALESRWGVVRRDGGGLGWPQHTWGGPATLPSAGATWVTRMHVGMPQGPLPGTCGLQLLSAAKSVCRS